MSKSACSFFGSTFFALLREGGNLWHILPRSDHLERQCVLKRQKDSLLFTYENTLRSYVYNIAFTIIATVRPYIIYKNYSWALRDVRTYFYRIATLYNLTCTYMESMVQIRKSISHSIWQKTYLSHICFWGSSQIILEE